MIQRIQSLYLSLTILLSLIFLKSSLLSFINISGTSISVGIAGLAGNPDFLKENTIQNTIPLSLLMIIIPCFSLIIIFLFRKRKIQILLVKILIAIIAAQILLCVFYIFKIQMNYNVVLKPGFNMLIPGLQLIFSYLAYKGIKKDDELVRSYDRLR